jgi:hypothetical protein
MVICPGTLSILPMALNHLFVLFVEEVDYCENEGDGGHGCGDPHGYEVTCFLASGGGVVVLCDDEVVLL